MGNFAKRLAERNGITTWLELTVAVDLGGVAEVSDSRLTGTLYDSDYRSIQVFEDYLSDINS